MNSILPAHHQIAEFSFKNSEQLGTLGADRRAIYDIYCESEQGEKFIVELQKAKQNFFKDRSVYYSTFPIREQAEKGMWNYQLKAIYFIGILDFTYDDFEEEPERSEVVHTIKLKNQNNRIFYDKLTFIYLEMPNFVKSENELDTRLDQWLYFLKNLENFQDMPKIFKDELFEKAFDKAELANLDQLDLDQYESSLKVYRDLKGVIDTAFEDGLKEGIEQGIEQEKREIAKMLKVRGLDISEISSITGLSQKEIEDF